MAAGPKWKFKARFRAKAYGWRGSALAISRLKEAVSEIKAVAKSDPVAAGDGIVSLMERIWPAFESIDTSSGALGSAIARTLDELIPILAAAPADHATRAKWLERLFEAVQNDGVEYLAPVEDRWGEIARYPDLINDYADRLIASVRHAWADHQSFRHVTGTAICLSCLLEAGRYAELQELLATRRMKFWPWHRFGAEALVRQGLWEAAIAFAEAARDRRDIAIRSPIHQPVLREHPDPARSLGPGLPPLRPACGERDDKSGRIPLAGSYLSRPRPPSGATGSDQDSAVTRVTGLPLQRMRDVSTSRSNVLRCPASIHRHWCGQHAIFVTRNPSSPPPSRCWLWCICSPAEATSRGCRKRTTP